MTEILPRRLSPQELLPHLGREEVLILDLQEAPGYRAMHVPGAVHLEAAALSASRPPVQGLLPDLQALGERLAGLGLRPGVHVVAYDEGEGLKACRLLWTLDVLGHGAWSLLDGGLRAWADEGLPLTNDVPAPRAGGLAPGEARREPVADRQLILERLGDPRTVILDVRSPAEYQGDDRRAARAGHIPGAVNVEWRKALDRGRPPRLRPEAELRQLYEQAGVTPDKEIIAYCQTHRRSAHTYVVLRTLGYPRVKGYPGSWSDWGNTFDTPVEP